MNAATLAFEKNVSLKPYTTLRTGGNAEFLAIARSCDSLAEIMIERQSAGDRVAVLGWGSNILPSDAGMPGYVLINEATKIEFGERGEVIAECGCGFQDLFLKCAQHGLAGLEFAVGIPGTLGGALVSNAGAYRSCVSEFLIAIDVVIEGERKWAEPSFMEFSYRDSTLRRPSPPSCALLRVRMRLPKGNPKKIYDEAREYQRQRISKQPAPASAGSFFKNVNDQVLAEGLETLPRQLKAAGVVPAGYLIEKSGLAGIRLGGAMFARRHANFILNVGNASASDIRRLAQLAKRTVFERFNVHLEEEVLYVGDWTGWDVTTDV